MARAALQWSVRDLAEQSGVHRNTITRIEAGAGAHGPTLSALRQAFEAAGVIFVAENGEGPGVRLRKDWKSEVEHSLGKGEGN
ncbi:helix-turn-helix transcriptional regulator [Ancylobacter sp. SL191]|nr:helix-turn-helix transcriptional regulator [Ancylobacter sp. SL191]